MKDINANPVKFSELTSGKNCIVFTYPKMGESGKFLPENLKDLKGLTGCTLQCKAYQENLTKLESPLNLQTFTTNDGKKFYRRQTLIIKNGEVVKRFNDVAEPTNDAANVLVAIERL